MNLETKRITVNGLSVWARTYRGMRHKARREARRRRARASREEQRVAGILELEARAFDQVATLAELARQDPDGWVARQRARR